MFARQNFAEEQTYGFIPQSLGPTPEKLATLREQLGLLGLSLGGGDNPTPKDYAALAEQFKTVRMRELLQVMMLRSMQQAVLWAALRRSLWFGL